MIDRARSQAPDVSRREVLFEFWYVGRSARVVAIDPITNTEVTIVGASAYNKETLKQMAARKLAYVIAKKQRC